MAGARSGFGQGQAFTTYADHQTGVDFHVVQGERELAADCRSLARFQLKGIPPMAAGLPKVEVTFTVNADGILEVHARELRSGVGTRVEVKPSYGLTDEEVERMLVESIEHAEEDIAARLLVDARVEAEQVLKATEGALADSPELLEPGERRAIEAAMAALRDGWQGSDHNRIRDLLEALDRASQGFAQRRMDRAIQEALRNRTIDEVKV
jgi:molecular chaperone HscA